jgi:hypothetical protein
VDDPPSLERNNDPAPDQGSVAQRFLQSSRGFEPIAHW